MQLMKLAIVETETPLQWKRIFFFFSGNLIYGTLTFPTSLLPNVSDSRQIFCFRVGASSGNRQCVNDQCIIVLLGPNLSQLFVEVLSHIELGLKWRVALVAVWSRC